MNTKTRFSIPVGRLFTLSLALAAAFCPRPAHGQTAVEAWVQRYGGPVANRPVASDDRAEKIAVDSAGNVIVAGSSSEFIGGYDWLIIKYSGGGIPLWTNRYSGPASGDDQAKAVAVDSSGNVLVTGHSMAASLDYVTIKYSGAGVPLWTNRYDGPANSDDRAVAVAMDSAGNVFVTGYSSAGNNATNYATVAYSAAGAPLWTNQYSGPLNGDNQAADVALDSSGNVFVTGFSLVTADDYDYATIKYSNTGVPLWTNRYNGPANYHDQAKAIAIDSSGNVFVTGHSYGTNTGFDYATIKYSNAGAPLWTNRYDGPAGNNDDAVDVAVDASGNAFVTGTSPGFASQTDYATIAYSASGAPLWTNRYDGTGNYFDSATAVAVDSGGRVIVTGYSFGTNAGYDYGTIAYSASGTPLWTNRYDKGDFATAAAVDGSGNVFVTGRSPGSGFGSGSRNDFATIAYSSVGALLWTNRYNGVANSPDVPRALAVDNSGNVVVAGHSEDSFGLFDWSIVAYSSAGAPRWTNHYNGPDDYDDIANAVAVDAAGNAFVTGFSFDESSGDDYLTIKYSFSGTALWTNRYNGPGKGGDGAIAMVVDASGNVIVTGTSAGTNAFNSPLDYATIKYSRDGMPLWTNRYNGPTDDVDAAEDIAVDGSGNVVVTGSSGTGSLSDYLTIKYSEAGVPLWTNRYNGPGNNSDYARAVAVDGNGNVFVTGDSWGGTQQEYATVAYSGAGVPLWTNRYHAPWSGNNFATAIAVDANGNVFVTGLDGGFATTNGGYATIKYSNAGAPLWTNHYNGATVFGSSDNARAIAVDRSGNVIVTGQSYRDAVTTDIATVAYSNAGVPLWTNRYNGPANGDDIPLTKRSLALSPDGSVYVAGISDGDYSRDQFPIHDFVTIKYAVS